MEYAEALAFLYNQLPMYQNQGTKALKPGLRNILALSEHLANPHQKFPSLHVGGTNGKGSSAHMLAAILQAAGYRVGLYTSPHLKSFTERIRLNGQEMDPEQVIHFVQRHYDFIQDLKPSFFEITVAMAFDYFARQKVDIAVIEVGLGGRLDSTNIITPQLALITNIGLDHQAVLGESLVEIAGEKAGIIKANTPVVIGEHQPEVMPVFEQKAQELGAPLYRAYENYQIKAAEFTLQGQLINIYKQNRLLFENLDLSLKGLYQWTNLPGVLMSVALLQAKGWRVEASAIQNGLEHTIPLTGLKGRWQIIGTNPLVVADVAHNPSGVAVLMQQVAKLSFKELHLVLGFSRDKEVKQILALYPSNAHFYFCQFEGPRALDVQQLARLASTQGLRGEAYSSVSSALHQARKQAGKEDLILVGGSVFTVATLAEL